MAVGSVDSGEVDKAKAKPAAATATLKRDYNDVVNDIEVRSVVGKVGKPIPQAKPGRKMTAFEAAKLDPKFKAKEWLRKTIRSTAAKFILVVTVC